MTMKKLFLFFLLAGFAYAQTGNVPSSAASLGTNNIEYTNCAAGTTLNLFAKLVDNAGSPCIQTATNSDTSGIVGVVVANAGTSGVAQVARTGKAVCIADNSVTDTDYLIAGTTTGGRCRSAGSTYPSSGQVLGRALASVSAAASLTYNVYGPGIQASSAGAVRLDQVTDPTASKAFALGGNTLTFTGNETSTNDAFVVQSTNSATSTGVLFHVNANKTSNAMIPFQIDVASIPSAIWVDLSGFMNFSGGGGITTTGTVNLQTNGGAGSSVALRAAQPNGAISLSNNSGGGTTRVDPFNDLSAPVNTTTVVNSSKLEWRSLFWNGSASTADSWLLQNVVATGSTTPATTLTLSHSGSSGASTLDLSAASTTKFGAATLQSSAAGTPTMIVKGQASASTDLFRVTSSTNTSLFAITSAGQIDITNADLITTTNGLTLRGASVTLVGTSTDVNLAPTSGNAIVRRDPNQVSDPVSTASVVLDPVLQFLSRYWNGSAAASDIWGFQNVVATGSTTPASILTLTHSGSAGALTLDLSVAGTVKLPNATAYTQLNNNTSASATPAFHTMSPLVKVLGTGTPTTSTTFTDLFNPTTLSIQAGFLSVGDTIDIEFDVDSFGGSGSPTAFGKLGIVLNGTELITNATPATTGAHTQEHVTLHLSVNSTTQIGASLIRSDPGSGLRIGVSQITVLDVSSNALVLHPGGYLSAAATTGQLLTGIGCHIAIYHGSNF